MLSDTIVAIATPPGEGGVAVVRMSGPQASSCLKRVFRARTPVEEMESHKLYLGRVVDSSEKTLDRALAVIMRAPRSFTGEEVVEIQGHGGRAVVELIVRACLEAGARLAHPGEFTQRAFLNGRLDLAQAESVADLIRARSAAAAGVASGNLEGRLSRKVTSLRGTVLDWMSLLEAEIDFGDEIDELEPADHRTRLSGILSEVEELLRGGQAGRRLFNGLVTVLVGPPNAGKSTFLNLVLGTDRALVTPVAGTTRDRLEEDCSLEGVPLRLIDTAGLRAETDDEIEKLGMERSRKAVEEADLVVVILDQSQEFPSDLELGSKTRPLLILNKADLGRKLAAKEVGDRLGAIDSISVSLIDSQDHDRVLAFLAAHAQERVGETVGRFSLNDRHLEALVRCREALHRVGEAIDQGMSVEFLCLDLRAAAQALGEIVGIDVNEEVLDRIFSTFCLGK